ncbi:MAG: prepilin-type N-terminal cleavage/methylation domain-containing protein [Candidatus Sumerlaeia bacterium]|nr:prepilin-type N-terminal cleavage/methylation domain-containing protein [Candidatus Sumerlaeia bacterium]
MAPSPFRHRRRGVTFLEIMVVIVILGILAAVALPNMMGTRSRAALRTAARSMTSAGIQARQAAIAYGKETELIIDMENGSWMILLMPEEEDERVNRGRRRAPVRSSMRTEREMAPGYTSEEQIRELPSRVTFGEITTWSDKDDARPATNRRRGVVRADLHRLTFYPNGSSSGMAIELKNDRDRSLTVDFDRSSGRPEIYEGPPKTLAQKLTDMGLNPEDYGIFDERDLAAGEGRRPGEGFTRIGWSEEERIGHYESVAERLMRRAQRRHTEENEGAASAYMEAQRWGSR